MPAGQRSIAAQAGEKYYTNGKPCPSGHFGNRRTSTGTCLQCELVKGRESAARNRDTHRAASKAWKERNAQRCRDSARAWQSRNREERRAYMREYMRGYPRDRPAINAYATARRAAKLLRTPKWVDMDAIRAVYDSCPTGFHVDHIVPLQGATVSGLHVPWNLQVIPAHDNLSKGNRVWPTDH